VGEVSQTLQVKSQHKKMMDTTAKGMDVGRAWAKGQCPHHYIFYEYMGQGAEAGS
jgi:hypothetical protein